MASSSINEIKSVIRGLLISSPEEITVMKLRRDFRAQEGRDIPFFEFGFRDVTAFLRSIPDVCQIIQNANGPYAVVRLVESDKSVHVSSLVMRQRTTTNKGHRRRSDLSTRRRFSQINNALSARYRPKETLYSSYYHGDDEKKYFENSNIEKASSTHYHGNNEKKDFENSNTEKISSENKHAEIAEYDLSYLSCNGDVPVEEPCLTVSEEKSEKKSEDCCHLESDDCDNGCIDIEAVVDFLLEPVLNDKGTHINELLEYLHDSLLMYGIESKNVEEILRRKCQANIVNDYVYHPQSVPPPTCKDIPVQEVTNLQQTENAALEVDVGHQDDGVCSKGNLTVPADTFVPTSSGERIQKLERNLYSLMKDHCQGILGSELKEKYKMKFAVPLNFQVLGRETVWDLALSMPHIFNLIPLPNGDFQLFPTWYHSEQKRQEPKLCSVEKKKEPVVPVITKRNVQWLMQGYPNGLLSKDFEQTYKDTFLGGIELKQMGFSSVEEFLKYLEKMNVLKIQVTESDVWLLPSSSSSNLTIEESPLPSKELMGTQVDMNILRQRFPTDVVGPDSYIEQVKIPSWIKKSSMIEVFVQEVNNPHHFWVTLCGEKYTRALDSLMDDLQAFYCSKSHNYKMPRDLIREGQDCVTLYIEEWHRARITCIISSSEVEVFFYDYGTKSIVKKDDIHFLHVMHSALPAQAIQAGLANIAPVEDKWTQETSKRFLELIANKALIGLVKAVDRQNSVFSLFLCDTSGKDDLYIHEVLIAEGFAVDSTVSFSENESQNVLTTEEHLDRQSLLASEQEEMKPKANALESFIKKINIPKKEYPTLNSIPNDLNQQSDNIQEIQIEDFSKISSGYSLPVTLLTDVTINPVVSNSLLTDVTINPEPVVSNSLLTDVTMNSEPVASNTLTDVMKSSQHVSSNTLFTDINPQPVVSSSSLAVCAPKIIKACSKSATFHQQVAPPPGFSCVTKSASESGVCDKRQSQACSSLPIIEDVKKTDAEEKEEVVVVHTNQSLNNVEDAKKQIPEVSSHKNIDPREFAKGVSSGVNTNFVPDKAYLPNSYSYPNWTSVQPPYPNFQVFPTIPPVNVNSALAPLSFGAFPVPSIPNPLEYCNMWYYEQCRQQAFLQGMLAHQQMAASTFPPLPPGIYGPNTYSTTNTQPLNHMNISEVYPSESSPVKLSVETHSTECQAEVISSATQTDIFSVCKSSNEQMKVAEVSSVKVSLSDAISDANVQTDQECTQLHENNSYCDSRNDQVPLQVNNISFTIERDGTSCQEKVDGSNLNLQTNMTKTINSNETNVKINSVNNSLENEIKCESAVEKSIERNIFVDGNYNKNIDAIQNESEKTSKPNIFEQALNYSQIPHDETVANELIFEIENNNEVKGSGSNTHLNVDICVQNLTKQMCDSKSEENVVILPNDKSIIEDNGVTQSVENKDEEIGEQLLLHDFAQETCKTVSEEQELAQIVYANSLYNEEISCNEDDSHEHEMLEKAQEEYVTNKMNFEKNKNIVADKSENLSQAVEVPEKIASKETYDCTREKNSNVLVSKLAHSLSAQVFTYQSNEKHSREIKEPSDNEKTVNFEESVDRLLKYNKQLTVQRFCERNSEQPQLKSNFYHEGNPKNLSPTPGALLSEFGALTISRVQPNVNMRVDASNVQHRVDCGQSIVDPVPKALKTPSKSKHVRPVLGAKLSNEVSASIIPGPTQPAMTQKADLISPSHSPVRSKNRLSSCDPKSSAQPLTWKTTWVSEEASRPIETNQINHESSRNVAISSTIRNLSKQTSSNRHKERRKQGENNQFVKKISLCEKEINQINLDGRPYVLTDEIVDYFTPFNGRHVILKILEARKVEINFLEMSRRRRPEFFECLDKSDIKCISRGPTGNVIGSVHMVPLRSIPYMLRALNKDDATLSMEVKEEMEKFDPNDPYWSGYCD